MVILFYFSISKLLDCVVDQIENAQPMFSQFLNGYLTLFCVFTGVVLNILCIYVFLKYRNGSPVIQYYLVSIWMHDKLNVIRDLK